VDAASRRAVVSLVWSLPGGHGVAGVDIDTTEILESVDLPPQWGVRAPVVVEPDEAKGSLLVRMSADFVPPGEINLTQYVSKGTLSSPDRAALIELLREMREAPSGVHKLPSSDGPAWWGFARLWSANSHLLVVVPEDRMTTHARTVADSIEERTREQIVRYGIIVLVAILMVVVLAMFGSAKFIQPINSLAGSVQRVAEGDLETKARVTTGDELEDLAGNFNRMIERLKGQMAALAAEASAREQVEAELRIAREMQDSLLPECGPPYSDHPEFDLAAINLPAKVVAGDFYDFAFLDDRTLALVMADVAGKGVPAALFMTVGLTLLRVAASTDRSPGEVFRRVNRVLHATGTDRSVFVTAVLAYYDLESGRLRYANAGHCAPLVVRRNGSIDHLAGPTGTILAPFEGMDWGTNEATLEPGDRLVLYTDGITEARTAEGNLLGEEGLEQFLATETAAPRDPGSAELAERIGSLAVSRMDDDVTVLVLRRT
jgi:sigma-B regulation protein RsbU (phosphoserine phosphatase)